MKGNSKVEEKPVVEDKQQFYSAKRNQHFKMDKQTKKLLASLGKHPVIVKLSSQEQKELGIKIDSLTKNSFKELMVESQLSSMSAAMGPMRDPLWKSKKDRPSEATSEGTDSKASNRKGKKSIKMRKENESV